MVDVRMPDPNWTGWSRPPSPAFRDCHNVALFRKDLQEKLLGVRNVRETRVPRLGQAFKPREVLVLQQQHHRDASRCAALPRANELWATLEPKKVAGRWDLRELLELDAQRWSTNRLSCKDHPGQISLSGGRIVQAGTSDCYLAADVLVGAGRGILYLIQSTTMALCCLHIVGRLESLAAVQRSVSRSVPLTCWQCYQPPSFRGALSNKLLPSGGGSHAGAGAGAPTLSSFPNLFWSIMG